MRNYGFTYESTMCNPKLCALKFVSISIFKICFFNDCTLFRYCVSLQAKLFPTSTPPKHMQAFFFISCRCLNLI